MDNDEGLMVNLTVEHRGSKDRKKKTNRNERLKRKRDERRIDVVATADEKPTDAEADGDSSSIPAVESPPSVSSPGGESIQPKKKKQMQSQTSTPSKNKFSSLFRNNPEIPILENTSVDEVNEKVFSSQGFSSLNLHPYMVSNLESLGFHQATNVQKKAIPHILKNVDVLIKSQTGSGKTMAYGIPIIQLLQSLQPRVERCHGPYAIVIVPTRELAVQTYETFLKLVKPFTWIVPGCVMGGEQKKKEKSRLRKGINVLVSTPGRLLDHLKHTQSLQMCRLQWLVIDEADRLLELGFEEIAGQIIAAIKEQGPEEQRTILLSATLSPGVERLAGMSLQSPVQVDLSQDQTDPTTDLTPKVTLKGKDAVGDPAALSTPSGLRHHYLVVPNKLRLVTLAAFILWKCKYSNKRNKMLVFMATQDAVDFHHMLLSNILSSEDEDEDENLTLLRLHGDMAQKERTAVFKKFSETSSGILLCTDVAARGLDMPALRWIVQFTPPTSAEDYVHRAGRTARVGSQGRAVLFLSPSEVEYVKVLNTHKISLTEVKMDDVLQTLLLDDELVMRMGQRPNTVQERATALQMKIEEFTLSSKELRPLARKAYQSYIRAYSTFPSALKHIFHVKNLHLGHVAKSFGLQEAPTRIGGIVGKFAKMDRTKPKDGKKKERDVRSSKDTFKRPSHLNVKAMLQSEFASGLTGGYRPVMLNTKKSRKIKRLKQPRK